MRTGLVLAALCTSAAAASSSSFTNTTHCPPLPFTRVQQFKSSDIVISSVEELGLPHEADASQYVVVEGLSIGGPMILDGADLSLVYSGEEYRSTSNLAVKELGGVRYLTFNNGGKRIVLDEQYQERDDLQLDDNETHHAADLLTEMDTGIANCEGWERMKTYKLSKFHWQGRPTWPPHMFVQLPPSGHLADPPSVRLSWNGATEVQSWAILASHNATKVNYYKNVVAVATDTGFETYIVLNETTPRYIGAAAIGADGEVLGSTYVMDLKTGQPVMLSSGITRITAPFRAPSVAAGAMGGTIFGVSMLFYAFNYLKKRKENAAEVVEETPRYSKVRFAV